MDRPALENLTSHIRDEELIPHHSRLNFSQGHDTLSSASDAGVDENKKEAAEPLYWLNTKNGVLWPACAIIIIHHDNKEGGYRGSTAIRAAVSEMWHVAEIPEDKREHLPNYLNQRLVTIGRQERDEGQEAPQDPERRLHR